MKIANAHRALVRLTNIACLGAGLFTLSTAVSAQSAGQTGELGIAGRPGGMQIAGKIICPGGPTSLGPFGQVDGLQRMPSDRVCSTQGREASIGKVTQVGGFVRYEPLTNGPWSLGRFDEVDGLQRMPSDRVCSTQGREASIGKVTQVGGFVRYEPLTNGPWSLGRFDEVDGLQRRPSDRVCSAQEAGLGTMNQVGNPSPWSRNQGEWPRRLGPFKEISLPPLPGAEPLVEEDPALVSPMRTVVLHGRSGIEYSLYVLPMGSSSGPAILVSRGMLFGTDPSEEPRKYVLRVPSELGVLLVPTP